jgi:COP9 signalosome complex subunit 1
VSVELSVMSVAFNLDLATLERTLAELIQENKIAARIDSHKKILHARHSDQRNDTFAQALQVGHRYVRDVRSLIMRLSLVEHDIAVRGADAKRKGRGGGGGERERVSAAEEEQLYRAQAESMMAVRR